MLRFENHSDPASTRGQVPPAVRSSGGAEFRTTLAALAGASADGPSAEGAARVPDPEAADTEAAGEELLQDGEKALDTAQEGADPADPEQRAAVEPGRDAPRTAPPNVLGMDDMRSGVRDAGRKEAPDIPPAASPRTGSDPSTGPDPRELVTRARMETARTAEGAMRPSGTPSAPPDAAMRTGGTAAEGLRDRPAPDLRPEQRSASRPVAGKQETVEIVRGAIRAGTEAAAPPVAAVDPAARTGADMPPAAASAVTAVVGPRGQGHAPARFGDVSAPELAAASTEMAVPKTDARSDLVDLGAKSTQVDAPRSAPPVPHGAPAAAAEQVRALSEAIVQARGDRIEIALSPEELGRVRISLSHREDGVSVQLSADRPETTALLRRNMDQLADALRDAGLGSVDIGFGDRGEQAPPDQRRDMGYAAEPEIIAVAPQRRTATDPTRVDLRF
ncbi:flagellar hook-length control protein FliK [Palleronia rufa]|uniref:flagellar hook-length control protein FliK n=1 Tax=Palleronia rufa TaxID=1530186 RepID=UPI00068B469F|nr:flagellar hook-length control protein FliK [Palleronia rufa]